MTRRIIEQPVEAETSDAVGGLCHHCPLFNSEQGTYGWCQGFDRMAKPNHKQTASCNAEIAASEKVVRIQQSIAQRNYDTYLENKGYYFDNGVTRWEPMHEVDLELETETCAIDEYNSTDCEEF